MPKTDYDSESKLQLHPLIDAIEAAAANKDKSKVQQPRERMLDWMPPELPDDHRQKAMDIAVRLLFEMSGQWERGVEGVTAKMVEKAAEQAIRYLNK